MLPLGSWAHAYIGRLMIIPNHRVSAVVSRSPTDMVRAAQPPGEDESRYVVYDLLIASVS